MERTIWGLKFRGWGVYRVLCPKPHVKVRVPRAKGDVFLLVFF